MFTLNCRAPVLVAAALLLGEPAAADTKVAFSIIYSNGAPSDTQELYVSDGTMLIKRAGGDASTDLLFEEQGRTLSIIEHKSKRFTVIDQNTLSVFANTAGILITELQAQLSGQDSKTTQAQNKKKRGIQVIKLGKRSKIAGYPCDVRDIQKDSKTILRICVADTKTLKLPARDARTIETFRDFGNELSKHLKSLQALLGGLPDLALGKFKGLPLSVKQLTGENPSEMKVTSISHGKVKKSILAPPKGYQAIRLFSSRKQ